MWLLLLRWPVLECTPVMCTVQQVHGMPLYQRRAGISTSAADSIARSGTGVGDVAWPGLGAEHFRSTRYVLYTEWMKFNRNSFGAVSQFVSCRKCVTVEWLLAEVLCVCYPYLLLFFFVSSSSCVCQSMDLLPERTQLLVVHSFAICYTFRPWFFSVHVAVKSTLWWPK